MHIAFTAQVLVFWFIAGLVISLIFGQIAKGN